MSTTENLKDVGALDRTTYLGSSDISAVMGLSPWKSPLDVYLQKTGQAEPERDKPVFRRGKRWEAPALEMLLDYLEDHYGTRPPLIDRNRRYRDPQHPWMASEIDAEIELEGETVNVEIKTVHPLAAGDWGDLDEGGNFTDQVPIHYYAQGMFGLMVTQRRRTIFGALVGADNMTPYEIVRDDATIAGMRSKAVEFWEQNVLRLTPPPPLNLEDVYTLFRRDADTLRAATPEIAAAVAELRGVRASIKSIEARDKELAFQIGSWLLGADVLLKPEKKAKHIVVVDGKPALSFIYTEQNRIDTERLRNEQPTIAAQYNKQSKFFQCRLPQTKRIK